jgi:hypothetical protein
VVEEGILVGAKLSERVDGDEKTGRDGIKQSEPKVVERLVESRNDALQHAHQCLIGGSVRGTEDIPCHVLLDDPRLGEGLDGDLERILLHHLHDHGLEPRHILECPEERAPKHKAGVHPPAGALDHLADQVRHLRGRTGRRDELKGSDH